jgi:hypothetical protein
MRKLNSVVGQQLTIHYELDSHLGTDDFVDRFLIVADLGSERFIVFDHHYIKDVEIDIPKMYGEKLLFYIIHPPDPNLRNLLEKRIDEILNYIPKKRAEIDEQEEYLKNMKTKLNALSNTVQT